MINNKQQIHLLVKKLALSIYNQKLTKEEKEEFDSNILVLSCGTLNCDIITVARDLGKDEIEQRKPLIGEAGQLFRNLEKVFDIETYKTNIVPFRPKNNKVFSESIRKKFYIILEKQIELVNPKIIFALGNEALEFFTGYKSGIIERIRNNNVYLYKKSIKVIPVVHPSFLVRNGISIKSLLESEKLNEQQEDLYLNLFFEQIKKGKNFVN